MHRFGLFLFLFLFAQGVLAQAGSEQQAAALMQQGQYDKAAQLYEKLFSLSKNSYHFDGYIKALISAEKWDEAEKAAKKQWKDNPDVVDYALALGKIYSEKGERNKADDVYGTLLKTIPPDRMKIYDLATRFYQGENADFAIRIFEHGRKILRSPDEFTMELINLYRFKKDKGRVADEYLRLLGHKPEFIFQAQNTLGNMLDTDDDLNTLQKALLKYIQRDPQQMVYSEMLSWLYIRRKEYDMALNQALALSRRRKDDGEEVFKLGRMFMDDEAYETAVRAFDFVVKNGTNSPWYIPARIEMIDAQNRLSEKTGVKKADLLALEQQYRGLISEFGQNANTAFALQRLADLQAGRLNSIKDAEKTLESLIAIKGLPGNTLSEAKLQLGNYYLYDQQPWEATLIYSQVEKAFAGQNAAQEAKFRNAMLAYYTGEFSFAKSQFDILKAATSQLIANDALNMSLLIGDNLNADSTGAALRIYARAGLLREKKQYEQAQLTLDSIDRNFPNGELEDDVLMARARILIDEQAYERAVSPLKKIIENHSFGLWADDALFTLGDIYENRLNNKQEAMNCFEKIITEHSSSLWVNEARKRFRTLRGDLPVSGS
ncbi:MAG: tetratricopeptide repeat protein [Mucilaginibacter polytrichastri]|nr:tetratricopeptide repeat protein [Mucilaginibacter polytrichastri]